MDPTSGIIYNQSGEATLSFYVFENLRKPGYEGAYPYPDSIASDAYQCLCPSTDCAPYRTGRCPSA